MGAEGGHLGQAGQQLKAGGVALQLLRTDSRGPDASGLITLDVLRESEHRDSGQTLKHVAAATEKYVSMTRKNRTGT